MCRRACCSESATQKYARIQAYFVKAVVCRLALCPLFCSVFRFLPFVSCRRFHASRSSFLACCALRVCVGVLGSGCYALRVRASKYFVCGVCFALSRGVSALFKVVGCVSQHGKSNALTTAQQGAAPDRLQLRSLRSCLAPVSALSAAGELSVGLRRAA